jgi:ABC-type antimicrobial peptide transport system permease subunit
LPFPFLIVVGTVLATSALALAMIAMAVAAAPAWRAARLDPMTALRED